MKLKMTLTLVDDKNEKLFDKREFDGSGEIEEFNKSCEMLLKAGVRAYNKIKAGPPNDIIIKNNA